ncbi:MAG: 16S rRNA (uracil(1498)-N(3))-methyltransferase [Thermodesulfovibrionales bacterium]
MPRIFLPITDESKIINITGEKAHYLIRVLRCKVGDHIEVLDGKGRSFYCEIRGLSKREVRAEIISMQPCDTESPLNLILFQGLLKGEKMDIVIQKTTELGIKEIYPVITERSQVRETGKIARWRKIAEDASRQSGRTFIPLIHEPVEYHDALFMINEEYKKFLLTRTDSAVMDYSLKGFIFWEGGGISLKDALSNPALAGSLPLHFHTSLPIYLFIGPEGGFTAEEVRGAESGGLITIALGKRILRAETASIVSTTLIQFLIGDLS